MTDAKAENPAYDELEQRLAEITDLSGAARLLAWDQQTKMPPAGAQARATQLGSLSRTIHEKFVDPRIGELLEELRPLEEGLPADSNEASLIRVARRDWEKAIRVPPELTAEMRREGSYGIRVWGEARAQANFELLRPHLEKNLELRRRYVECFEPADETYDILLDDYEPGMKTAEVREVFDRLKEELIPLIASVDRDGEDTLAGLTFERETQTEFILSVLEKLGYDPTSWRLDPTPHPFMSSSSPKDIRITTNYDDTSFRALFASMHEFGHGIYEHGVEPAIARSPLGTGASMALHESQSRMWENLVGRSPEFWRGMYPEAQRAFPQLEPITEERFLRYVNRVAPSFIRVDADEVTYTMHIILRFEVEQDLIEGRVPVAELPELFDARMKEYLGVDVENDAQGVLQDMHWAGGMFGYFPTYALGNVISVQIWNRVSAELGDLPAQVERGEFGPLREWLREHLYRLGRKFTPQETLERVTGSKIDPEPYLAYLREKHFAGATA